MEPLKDQFFNPDFYKKLTKDLSEIYPKLDSETFLKAIQKDFQQLELMERLELISDTLKSHLPENYPKTLEILYELAPKINGFAGMALPNFIQKFGLEHFDLSLQALKYLTAFSSSEFAVRVYLKADFQKTIRKMEKWAMDENVHVRRLASEGSRPRLPWSFKLDEVINNPKNTARILDTLKSDPELYVKKSVGNHLNDISKDHAEYMLDTVSRWDLENDHSNWIVKRAIRTLVKAGHPKAFALLGFDKKPDFEIKDFILKNAKIKLGEELVFSFDILSSSNRRQKINIDYVVHYQKKNGELSPKVFKLKEMELNGNQKVNIAKKHRFENFTTRKHYYGPHQIQLSVNGSLQDFFNFELIE
jgi:3-methyladenine DNA glycosylase AlkC